MPFKSEKQRKWMYANEPEMAKKWEKEEAIRGKLRNLIKQEIKSINEGWWEDLSDKAQAAYIKKHGEAPNSSDKKEDDAGSHIRKVISKGKKGREKMKKLNRDWDAKTSTASDIAKDMGGNMTGAVKKIEKIKKGLSDDPKVKAALRKANESVNEDNIKFSKEEMSQLHKDGKVEKGGHTIEFNESTKEYGKTLDKIAKDRQLKSISKKDRDTLIKIAKLMKRANESINEKMGPEQYHKYMQYVFDTQFKTPEEKKMKKSIIKKINKAQKKKGLPLFKESINEGFEKYHLGGLLDSKLKKRLERAIKLWGGKIDSVGQDYIKFRLSSSEVTKLPMLLKKLDQKKNVWIGDKRKKNIWDRRKHIDKLGEAQFFRAKQMVLLPDKKMYFDPMSNHLWLMGPHGGPDLDDDPIEPRDRDYNKIIRKLSGKDKSVLKKAMRTRKRRKEATTSVSVPGYLSPKAFSKSTQNAIDIDDEDDEKSESMAAPFRRRNSRGLGRVIKTESVNESDLGLTYKKGKTVKVTHKKSGKELVIIDKPNVKREYEKIGYFAEGQVNEARLVGYDKSYLDNAKKKLKVPHEITNIEYKTTRQRGPHDKFVRIWFKLKWKPGTRLDTEEKFVSVFYDSPERLKMIGKTLKLKLKESVNELSMAPFSSQEARSHINSDIKDMSKLLGKTSQKVIKIMMDGVKGGKYTAMDISRGIKEGPAKRTHFGEMTFIQSLWNKMREKFRKYSKDGKLS